MPQQTILKNRHNIVTEISLGVSDSEEGIITGTAHVCGVLNSTNPPMVLLAGSFTKTINEGGQKVPIEIDHGSGIMKEVGIGEFSYDGNVLTLTRGMLNMDSTYVREEVYPRLKHRAEHGMATGLSVVVELPKGKATFKDGAYHVSEVILKKVGIVDVPANEPSVITTVMSEEKPDTEVAENITLAKTFNDILNEIEVREEERDLDSERYKLDSALSSLIYQLTDDDTLTPIQVKAAVTQGLSDYATAMLTWLDALLALKATEPAESDTEGSSGAQEAEVEYDGAMMGRGDKARNTAAMAGIHSRVVKCASEIQTHMKTLRGMMNDTPAKMGATTENTIDEPEPETTALSQPETTTTQQVDNVSMSAESAASIAANLQRSIDILTK